MKKLFLIIMIINMSIILQAQNVAQKLINNPDITWVGESEIQISFENEDFEDSFTDTFEDNKLFSSSVMKYSEEVMHEIQYTGHFLSNKINEILNKESSKSSDNNVEGNTDEIKPYYYYDLKLLWYYDEKTNKMESLLQSITPLVGEGKVFNEKGNGGSITISMEQNEVTNLSIEKPEVIWAKLLSIQAYDFSKIKVLKGDTKKTLKTVFHDNVIKGFYPVCKPGEYGKGKKHKTFTESSLKEYTVDKGLNSQIGITEDKGVNFDDINLVGVEHKWYWDESQNKLVCDLNRLELYRSYKNKEGDLLFSVPNYIIDVK